jgi:tetratricopeptide (TPR) repeat protein
MLCSYVAAGLALVCFWGGLRDWRFPFAILHSKTSLPNPGIINFPPELILSSIQGVIFGGQSEDITLNRSLGEPLIDRRADDDIRAIVGEVPAQPPSFQSRSTLLTPLRQFRNREVGQIVYAVTGMRGVGKTQIVAAYARECINAGWRLVAWINAGSLASTLDGLAAIAIALGLHPNKDQAAAALALRHRLETAGDRCLVVLDNCVKPDAIRPYLPVAGSAQILITSADQSTGTLGTNIRVGVFTEAESLAYLAERTGSTDHSGARQVAAELGYLPLALAQAAAVITTQGLAYSIYVQRLRALPVADYVPRTVQDPYPQALTAAILLALQAARDSDPSGLAGPIMTLLALMSPAGIPRDLIYQATSAMARPRRRHPHYTSADVDVVLGHLARTSLLTFDVNGTVITAHRLTMRVIREEVIRTGMMHSFVSAAIHALQVMGKAAEPVWLNVGTARNLVQQINALSEHLSSINQFDKRLIVPDVIRLRIWALRCLNTLRDDPDQAISLGRQLQNDCEQALGAQDPSTLVARNNLAKAYQSAGRLTEAISLFERVLTDRRRLLGADHPNSLAAANDLADAYQSAGRLAEAISLFARVLVDRERLLGPDHPDTLSTRHDLGHAYMSGRRWVHAIPILEQSVTSFERVLGADHPFTMGAWNNLARAYESAGRVDEAILLFKRTAADFERVLGPEAVSTLGALNNLAGAYRSAGRVDEAILLFERTIADFERILGPEAVGTLGARNNLAMAYQSVGRLADAIPLFERTLMDRERILATDHPDILASRSNLAFVYQLTGRLGEAVPLFEQALADRERVLGPDHPDTLASRANLAYGYRLANRFDDALHTFEQSIGLFERVLGSDHPDTTTLRQIMTTSPQ